MTFERNAKEFIRPARDIAFAFFGYLYDFIRYFKYAGWKYKSRLSVRDFKAVKIYHRLEKSMSFHRRDSNSGWGAALELIEHLSGSKERSGFLTYHEKIALKVLVDFIKVADSKDKKKFKYVIDFLMENKDLSSKEGGVLDKSSQSLRSGKLPDPEGFFLSRHTVRDFDSSMVPEGCIKKAIYLALNTPSVCNRQASFVYWLNTRKEIDKALMLQNGNRGFGHEIPCLLILCADLSAFDTAGERYQHWIDGGMFSMSVIWALHSLGLSSCCLNWSKGPIDDLRLRNLVSIRNEHTVLMMLAVGFPKDKLKVCFSARKPVEEFYTKLD